jgi:hypothetical protein
MGTRWAALALATLAVSTAACTAPPPSGVPDPCPLLDPAALATLGPVQVVPDYGPFSTCIAVVGVPEGEVHLDVRLVNAADLAADDVPTAAVGTDPVIVEGRSAGDPAEFGCARHVLLPGGDGIGVAAVPYGDVTGVDFCALATRAATDTATRWTATRTVATRADDAGRRVLAGLDACALLDAAAVDRATTAAGAPVDVPRPVPAAAGFGGWTCTWGAVRVDFTRDLVPSTAVVAGRAAMHRDEGDEGHNCRTYVTQRPFTDSGGRRRAELVRVTVSGAAAIPTLCSAADDVAAAVVPHLPPP